MQLSVGFHLGIGRFNRSLTLHKWSLQSKFNPTQVHIRLVLGFPTRVVMIVESLEVDVRKYKELAAKC